MQSRLHTSTFALLALSLASCALLPHTTLKADGLPFDKETREVHGPNLRLPLTEAQQKEVASLGLVTFSVEQLALLRIIYPKIPTRLHVFASTFNDAVERFDSIPVDCIWLTPAEIAITIPTKKPGEDYEFDEGTDPGKEPAIEEPGFVFLRISPTGDLYHRGQQISLEDAKALIKKELSFGKKAQPSEHSLVPYISVTMAPTHRNAYDVARATATQRALSSYAEAMGVRINPTW